MLKYFKMKLSGNFLDFDLKLLNLERFCFKIVHLLRLTIGNKVLSTISKDLHVHTIKNGLISSIR